MTSELDLGRAACASRGDDGSRDRRGVGCQIVTGPISGAAASPCGDEEFVTRRRFDRAADTLGARECDGWEDACLLGDGFRRRFVEPGTSRMGVDAVRLRDLGRC